LSAIVLVHGAWHGAWCWEKIVSRLQTLGHNAIAVDLPGRAGDPTPPTAIDLRSHVAKVRRVIELQAETVVLAGHSLGGATVAQVCEEIPDRIRGAAYVTAFLPRDGESASELAQSDDDNLLAPHLVLDEAEGSFTLGEAAPLRDIFYAECSDADFARARAMLVAEPFAPAVAPLHLTAARQGRVPRAYVECTRDRAVSLALQRQMHTASPCEPVLTLDTDHSPFFSAPEALARFLASL
jgi:pimeloyl-ACP methyl ester carboxylesterase